MPYCSRCGTQFEAAGVFCQNCGAVRNELISDSAAAVQPGKATNVAAGTGAACPDCHQVDLVQRVRSVVSEGTTDRTYSGRGSAVAISSSGFTPAFGTSTINARSATDLAQRLAPPAMSSCPNSQCGFCGRGKMSGSRLIWFFLMFAGLIPGLIYRSYKFGQCKANIRNVEYPRWQQMMQSWNDLFYCHRCDVVFDPQKQRQARADQMYSLLGSGL